MVRRVHARHRAGDSTLRFHKCFNHSHPARQEPAGWGSAAFFPSAGSARAFQARSGGRHLGRDGSDRHRRHRAGQLASMAGRSRGRANVARCYVHRAARARVAACRRSGSGAVTRLAGQREVHRVQGRKGGEGAAGLVKTLRWVGLIGILSLAVARCVIVFAPQVLFDVDPAFDPVPLNGLGPAGSLRLDALLLASCVCGLLGEWLSGRGLDWKLLTLALLPLPIVIWHGWDDAGDMWRGGTWMAAAVACAVAAHLARDEQMRIILAAALAGTIAVLLVRAFAQVTFEHADTVRYFDAHREQILSDRGWAPDSSAARIYERRLRQPQPIGWFTTSNVFASFAAVGLVLWTAFALGAARARLQSGWIGALILCALAAAIALWLSGSKGAAAAALAGLGVLAIQKRRARPAVIIALVFLTLAAVAVRGALLPEGFAGEKSLLFRWHYTVASARMVGENALTGVGPDGFQADYTVHRPPRNPEEVASAHSIFWDWLCALGISGTAWIALALLILRRTGETNPDDKLLEAEINNAHARSIVKPILVVAALGLLPALAIEWRTLDGQALLMRIMGLAAFVAVAMTVVRTIEVLDRRWLTTVLAAAVTALVVHGQIEMTFQQPGSVVVDLTALGTLASGGRSPFASCRRASSATG